MKQFVQKVFKRLQQSSIFFHFILVMAMFLLTGVFLVAFISNNVIGNILSRELEDSQRAYLLEIKQILMSKFKLLEKSLQIFANDYRVQNYPDSESTIRDQDVLLFFDEIIDFHRYTKFEWSPESFKGNFIDEILFLNSREDLFRRETFFNEEDITDYHTMPVFQDIKDRDIELLWSPVYYNTIEGRHLPLNSLVKDPVTSLFLYQITVARKVVNRKNGKYLGVIAANIKLYHIAELFHGIRKPGNQTIYLINAEGQIIASNKDFVPLSQIAFDSKTSGIFAGSRDNVQFRGRTGNEESMLIKTPLPLNNWTLISSLPVGFLNRHVSSIQSIIFLFGLGSFLMVFLLCIIVLRVIIRPLNTIISFMDKIDLNENLNWSPPSNKSKEINTLASSLRRMLSRIQQLKSTVERDSDIKKELELKALRLQINPHFIFNSLDTIRWLARAKSSKVEDMIRNLTDFFKLGLSGGKTKITIKDEIRHVECYLKVQKLRYKKKLKYLFDIDEQVNDLPTIKVIIQPLVENAIYHGIYNNVNGGFIRISALYQDGKVVFEVIDNGKGMSDEELYKINETLSSWRNASVENKKNSGIGLFNVNARLKLTYGEQYGLEIKTELGKGTKAIIQIPAAKRSNGVK